MSEVIYNREDAIIKATEALNLGEGTERQEKVIAKADEIVSKPPGSSWYQSVLEKSEANNRDFFEQAMHEADWILYRGDPETGYSEPLPLEEQYGASAASGDGLTNLVAEFDGDRQKNLLSVETVLPSREVRAGDWMYIKIFSGGEQIEGKWEHIQNSEYINILDSTLNIDFYDLLVEGYDLPPAEYRIEYCVKRKAIWPNEWARVNSVTKNKMEIRVDAINEEALINIRGANIEGAYYAPMDIYHEKAGWLKAVNWTYDEWHSDETLIFKLAEKAPKQLKPGEVIEIWDEIVSTNSILINKSIFNKRL